MRPICRIAFALLLAAPLSIPAYAAEPDAPSALIGRSEAVRIAIQERLSAKFTAASEARKSEQGALVEYYSIPEKPLLWVDDNGLTDRAKSVMEEIGKADDYGLRASDYALPKASGFNANDSAAANWLAEAEIKISFAVLGYSARRTRRPHRPGTPDRKSRSKPRAAESFGGDRIRSPSARTRRAYLRSFQPDQPQFEALRQALMAARGLSSSTQERGQDPGWRGAQAGRRQRASGPAQEAARGAFYGGRRRPRQETLFDASVDEAVKRFQEAHGAVPDGTVGPGTRRMLNQQHQQAANPAKTGLILLNMERWRWLPHDLGSYYVNVNVPEFMLRVVDDGKIVHTTRVVVGKPDKQTPIFSNEMQEVVFNPFWNVPNSIKTEEIRPFLTEEGGWFGGGGWNTAVLERHNLRINVGGREVDPSRLDWNRVDIRSLNIYQPPGPDNVLGNVKFVFPNKHDVYMHDTPQKFLFANSVRAESHGCMRVQNPDELALTLLKHDQGWTAGRVASAIQNWL